MDLLLVNLLQMQFSQKINVIIIYILIKIKVKFQYMIVETFNLILVVYCIVFISQSRIYGNSLNSEQWPSLAVCD